VDQSGAEHLIVELYAEDHPSSLGDCLSGLPIEVFPSEELRPHIRIIGFENYRLSRTTCSANSPIQFRQLILDEKDLSVIVDVFFQRPL
jgi:hypothetical protein